MSSLTRQMQSLLADHPASMKSQTVQDDQDGEKVPTVALINQTGVPASTPYGSRIRLTSSLASILVYLLIFSALHMLCDRLLTTVRVYAQCEPITSYVPVTYTVTETLPAITQSFETDSLLTRTSTLTTTSTVHLSSIADQASATLSSQRTTYSFVVESGHTSWYGVSPSSGLALSTITTTIYILPSTTVTSVLTTTVAPVTIQPPPYVSTSFSSAEPVTTSTVTKTRTTTTVVTNTMTLSRSAFTSPGTGWNSTDSPTSVAGLSGSVSSVEGIPTTITGTIYWSIGTQVTSTSLTTLTLTLTRSRTMTSTLALITSTTSASPLQESSYAVASETSFLITPSSISSKESISLGQATVLSSTASTTDILAASYGGTAPASMVSLPITSTGSASALSAESSVAAAATSSSTRLLSEAATSFSSSSNAGIKTTSQSSSYQSVESAGSSTLNVSSPGNTRTSSSISTVASLSTTLASISPTSPPSSIRSLSSVMSSGLAPRSTINPSRQSDVPQVYASDDQLSQSASSSQSNTAATASTSRPISLQLSSSIDSLSSSGGQSPSAAQSTSLGPVVSSLSLTWNSSLGTFVPSLLPINTAASTATSGSASPTPSVCGEHGNFTLDFDDLPSFMPNQTIDITQAPPIFNGYHHLAFSNGYVYAPPPKDPFPPVSQPHLAVFLGNASGNGTNNTPTAMAPISGFIRPGEFGDGSSDANSAFWFDGYSTWIGCDNPGPDPCTYVVTAYAWNSTSLKEEQIDTQNLTTSGCPGFQDCHLQQVMFPPTFRGLSGLQIQAYKGPDQVMFFMDDVFLGWSNNTCAAGLQRLRSQRGGIPSRR